MPTPYELVFGDPALAQRLDAIGAEAEARQVNAADPERFLQLAAAGELLRELRPEGTDAGGLLDLGRLIFHAYHYRLAGEPLYRLDEPLARRLLASPPPVGPWTLAPPAPAGYLGLPRQLLWARVAAGAAAEPVDGIFWRADEAAVDRRLDALLVLGLRADRPGFSVAGVSAVAPDGGHWADLQARVDGPDFANILPGGELRGLHGLVTEAEVLKLLSLCFWHMAAHPDAAVRDVAGSEAGAAGNAAGAAAERESAAGEASPAAGRVYRVRDVARDG
jgi:hypothetical protein